METQRLIELLIKTTVDAAASEGIVFGLTIDEINELDIELKKYIESNNVSAEIKEMVEGFIDLA